MTRGIDLKKDQYIRKITWIGLILNLFLSVLKFWAGVVAASQTLLADAVHSLSDCTTDVAVIVGSYYWSKPADENHPYGHRRLETLVTVFIGIVLFGAAIGIVWKAITTLNEPPAAPPGRLALFVVLFSIISKEILYRWMAAIGKRIKSPALAANAWHHRTDAISSIPALIAIGGAIILPAWTVLDHVGAVVVSIFIFQAALKIAWPGLREMMETGASKETLDRIKGIACQNEAVVQVHGLRTRYVGNNLQVDMHVVVDGSITVAKGHDIAEDVKARILKENTDVLDVVVHIEPRESAIREDDQGSQPK